MNDNAAEAFDGLAVLGAAAGPVPFGVE